MSEIGTRVPQWFCNICGINNYTADTKCAHLTGEPVASPQATRPGTETFTMNSSNDDPVITKAVRKVVEEYGGTLEMLGTAAQPAAGTTPQAQQELLALRKKFKDEHMLTKQDSDRSEELIEIVCGRVVAPVDTLVLSKRDQATFLEALSNPSEPNQALREAFANCAPKQTRLTAEQLATEILANHDDNYLGPNPKAAERKIKTLAAKIEAFREESEAGLREQLDDANYLVSLYRKNVPDLQTEAAGLREENERLKEGERLVRDFLERDYGVSEITTICSRYDDAEQELTELRAKLRAKLAEQREELAEHTKWVMRNAMKMNEIGVSTHGDGIWYNKRAEAAEAEAAALREALNRAEKYIGGHDDENGHPCINRECNKHNYRLIPVLEEIRKALSAAPERGRKDES